ncbi:MAG: polysaccharide export protein [Candidatus Solibacter sp.]|nr:polysaccharide export protein [Candidatus Solibacter sp.]
MWSALSPAQGQQEAATPSTASSPSALPSLPSSGFSQSKQAYVISPDDLLNIDVFDVPHISRSYRVSPDGSLTLPLLPETIDAAGLTPNQLSSVIAEKLRAAGLVKNPHVTVAVQESRLHAVAVAGAVKRPQIYPVFGRTTFLDVLSQAEGLADDAGNTATITRGEVAAQVMTVADDPNQANTPPALPRMVTVDLKRLLASGDPTLNPDVFPGDRVTVQRAGIIYVVGAVNRAGGFPLKDDLEEMTVLKAIALAQDLKPTAEKNRAVIMRKNPQIPGGREEIPVDLKMVLIGRAPDRPMHPNDILFVPDSAGKKALRRAAEAAIQLTTGIIIWHR